MKILVGRRLIRSSGGEKKRRWRCIYVIRPAGGAAAERLGVISRRPSSSRHTRPHPPPSSVRSDSGRRGKPEIWKLNIQLVTLGLAHSTKTPLVKSCDSSTDVAEPPAGNLQPQTASSLSSLINTSEGFFFKSAHILFYKMAAASLSQLNPC